MLCLAQLLDGEKCHPSLHALCTKVKALTFVFKVQVHLGALMYGNRASELFTEGGFTQI